MLSELRELAASFSGARSAMAPAAASAAAPPASGYGMATRLAHPKGKGKGDPFNASSPVLYQTATFELDSKTMSGAYDYTRSGNPTRDALQEQMADLEGATRHPAPAPRNPRPQPLPHPNPCPRPQPQPQPQPQPHLTPT